MQVLQAIIVQSMLTNSMMIMIFFSSLGLIKYRIKKKNEYEVFFKDVNDNLQFKSHDGCKSTFVS